MCKLCELLDRNAGAEEAATASPAGYSTGEAQGSSATELEDAHFRAQVNLMRATAISKMTRAIRDLEDMGYTESAASVRRMLERMLPAEPVPEPPAQGEQATDDQGVPAEVSEVAKALAELLGAEVKVVRFPFG